MACSLNLKRSFRVKNGFQKMVFKIKMVSAIEKWTKNCSILLNFQDNRKKLQKRFLNSILSYETDVALSADFK
jgi:hypothetical protein